MILLVKKINPRLIRAWTNAVPPDFADGKDRRLCPYNGGDRRILRTGKVFPLHIRRSAATSACFGSGISAYIPLSVTVHARTAPRQGVFYYSNNIILKQKSQALNEKRDSGK